MIKNEKIDLAILLLLSLFLSIYVFLYTYVISLDGAFQYIPIAKDFVSGLYGKALGHNQQPLYSFLVASVSRWVSDFELAGKLVSSIFGILLIFPVYFLGKRIFDQKIAFYSLLFLAIHPYLRRFSADVLKESTYLFFLATAIWFSWRAMEREKRYPFLFISVLTVIAYLVRPDGIEILLIVLFYILFIKKFGSSVERWKIIFLLLLPFIVLLLPYLVYLKEIRGEWTFGKAKSIAELLGLGVVSSGVPLVNKILFNFKKLNLEILSIFHPLYVLFLAIGLIKKFSSHLKEGEKFLISFNVLHYVVLFLLVLNYTDWNAGENERTFMLSGRHILPLFIFSIYWVGEGFLTINQWIRKKVDSIKLFHPLEPERRSKIIFVTLLVLIFVIILPKTLKPQRYERLPEKWAGVWIKNQYGKGKTIFTSAHRVAYYADGNLEYVDIKKDTIDKIKTAMREKKALHLVIRERETAYFPEHVIKNNFSEVNRFEGKGMEKIILYKRIQ